MARLISDIMFTGSLGNLSAYRMKGSDKIILRKKGGATREKIQTLGDNGQTQQVAGTGSGKVLGAV